jgi:hypothetical protein
VSEQDRLASKLISKDSEEERLDSEQLWLAYLWKHSIVSRKGCTASRVSLSSEQKRLNSKQERLDSGQ